MRRRSRPRWLRIVVAEPVPVHLFDPRYTDAEARRGPYYRAGVYAVHAAEHRACAEAQVAALRARGFTVTVEEVAA